MVATRPGDLPDFANPPVVETVLSVQFEPLSQMRRLTLASFGGRLGDGIRKQRSVHLSIRRSNGFRNPLARV
jgi:hypothetical protein